MNLLVNLLLILPLAYAQFPRFGQGFGGRGNYGGGGGYFGNEGMAGGSERVYSVRGRFLCGIQGAQGARVSLWENRGGGQPFVYDERTTDVIGSFNVKAEMRGGGWSGGSSNGYLTLTINHNCEGQRQMSIELPPSYMNQGPVAVKTFDIGTINLEGRFSGEETNGFQGGGGRRGFGNRFGGGGGGSPVPI